MVTQNSSVKFSGLGLSTLLCREVKEGFVGVIVLDNVLCSAG